MTNASTRTMGSILSTCLVGAVTLTASTLTARVASADDDPFEVRWELDVPLGAAAALAGGSMHLLQDELVAERCGLDCDPNRVNAFDGIIAGYSSVDPLQNIYAWTAENGTGNQRPRPFPYMTPAVIEEGYERQQAEIAAKGKK